MYYPVLSESNHVGKDFATYRGLPDCFYTEILELTQEFMIFAKANFVRHKFLKYKRKLNSLFAIIINYNICRSILLHTGDI